MNSPENSFHYLRFLKSKRNIYGSRQFLKFLFREIFYRIWNQFLLGSYSQGYEDLVIDEILKNKKNGIYVDIGAGDPVRFNNTYRFYKKGWSGINVEPSARSFKKLKEQRKRDVNLQFLVGNVDREAYFYEFDPETLSTMNDKVSQKYQNLGFKLINKRKIELKKLSNIFSTYLDKKTIDFMSVDTEDSDLAVLESNRWDKFRPRVLCIEVPNSKKARIDFGEKKSELLVKYLESVGYRVYFANDINKIFVDRRL